MKRDYLPPTLFEGNPGTDALWEQKQAEAIELLRNSRSFFLIVSDDKSNPPQIVTIAGVQETVPNTLKFLIFVVEAAHMNLEAALEQSKEQFPDETPEGV